MSLGRTFSALAGIALFLAHHGMGLAATEPSTHLIITIDTETAAGCHGGVCQPVSIERRIWGKTPVGEYGIRMMMDILEAHEMQGTFFVNAFLADGHREAEVVLMVREIIERGHDVQFHAHEEFRCFRVCPQGH